MEIDASAAYLLHHLNEAGFEAYLVGGCVRDWICGYEPKDWDISTNATPQQIHTVFSNLPVIDTGIKHGTVTVLLEDRLFEITTFRSEGPYLDGRRPECVSFVSSIHEDLARRDFTINALAYSPTCGLIDSFGGKHDLEQRILRAVGEPAARITEDALRIMRALRFASTLGLHIDSGLSNALHDHRQALNIIAAQRIRDELMKLLVGENVLAILLGYPDVLAVPIPEIGPCIGFDQRTQYHCYDVWEHTARAVAWAEADPLVRLTLLFHDFGKPSKFSIDELGVGHFFKHDVAGAEIATIRLRALCFDNETIEAVVNLIKWHSMKLRVKNLPRWLNRLGVEGVWALIGVKRGDILAHSEVNKQERLEVLIEAEEALEAYLAHEPCFTRAALAVNGNDLMELGIEEGPRIGEILDSLLDAVMDGEIRNERAALISAARSFQCVNPNVTKTMKT